MPRTRATPATVPARRGTPRGFTLIETIATIVVLAVIGTITSSIVLTSMGVYNNWSTRADIQSHLSGAMDRVTTEIRTIGIAPGVTPVQADISEITSSSITLNPGTSSRTISLSGTNLRVLGAAGVTANLATNISAFTLSALDKDGGTIALPLGTVAACASVRRIQVTLTGTLNGTSQTIRTRVYIPSMSYGSNSP